MLTKDELTYFHSEEEFKQHDALASILLRNVSAIIPIEVKGFKNCFMVKSGFWMKKDQIKGYREFTFIAPNEELRDSWITSIEFLKTVSVHRFFQSQYSKVMLPIKIDEIHKDIYDINFSINSGQKYLNSNSNLDIIPNSSRKMGLKLKLNFFDTNSKVF